MPSIILTPWQVRAAQERRMKQIRVPVVPQPAEDCDKLYGPEMYEPAVWDKNGDMQPGEPIFGVYDEWGDYGVKCPFQPGTVLYVRETWLGYKGTYYYKADGRHEALDASLGGKPFFRWRSPATMPREAARYRLTVEEVRVQSASVATEEDAKAEGIEWWGTFIDLWNARYAKKGYPWSGGLWTFVGKVAPQA